MKSLKHIENSLQNERILFYLKVVNYWMPRKKQNKMNKRNKSKMSLKEQETSVKSVFNLRLYQLNLTQTKMLNHRLKNKANLILTLG